MSHWTDTDERCKKCGARALRTSSGNQLVCSKYREPGSRGCDWSTRTDGSELDQNHMFVAQYQQTPVPAATCKHPRLRAANGGTCPKGCP